MWLQGSLIQQVPETLVWRLTPHRTSRKQHCTETTHPFLFWWPQHFSTQVSTILSTDWLAWKAWSWNLQKQAKSTILREGEKTKQLNKIPQTHLEYSSNLESIYFLVDAKPSSLTWSYLQSEKNISYGFGYKGSPAHCSHTTPVQKRRQSQAGTWYYVKLAKTVFMTKR